MLEAVPVKVNYTRIHFSIDGRVGLRTLDPGKQTGFIHIEFARARASIEGTPDATTVRPVLAFLAG